MLPVERSKTFANTFEELQSASRGDHFASFNAVVPKAVEKVVVQVQKDPKPTAVRDSASRNDKTCVRFGFFITFVVSATALAQNEIAPSPNAFAIMSTFARLCHSDTLAALRRSILKNTKPAVMYAKTMF